jgi:nitroreductase
MLPPRPVVVNVEAAASLGLGTCWIAAFDPDVARQLFDLSEGVEPLAELLWRSK